MRRLAAANGAFWLAFAAAYLAAALAASGERHCVEPARLDPLRIFANNAALAVLLALAEAAVPGIAVAAMAIWGAYAGLTVGSVKLGLLAVLPHGPPETLGASLTALGPRLPHRLAGLALLAAAALAESHLTPKIYATACT